MWCTVGLSMYTHHLSMLVYARNAQHGAGPRQYLKKNFDLWQVMYSPQTWDDGEADCISRGGHLASLLDSDTQRLLNDHILSQ